jgi:hypothetical protein
MSKLLDLSFQSFNDGKVIGFFEDFLNYTTAGRFSTVASDSGTVAVADAVGGIITLNPSDGTVANNDETYLKGTVETFKFAANKPLMIEGRIQFAEGNTDDANIIFGIKDAVAANTLLDDGGGPAASYSGAVFFKTDGDLLWQVENSIGSTQKTTRLSSDFSLDKTDRTAGGSSYQKLRIEWLPKTSTLGDFMFYIDDVLVAVHFDQVYTSATEMQVCAGIKNGADTTVEALLIDWIAVWQQR